MDGHAAGIVDTVERRQDVLNVTTVEVGPMDYVRADVSPVYLSIILIDVNGVWVGQSAENQNRIGVQADGPTDPFGLRPVNFCLSDRKARRRYAD